MLLQQDPFRDLDRFSRQVFGTAARPTVMPLDAWREGDDFVVELDLPGVRPERIDIDVERNVLTVRAERTGHLPEGADPVAAERQWGVFSRQLVLGDSLDTESVHADYTAGVLTLRIPIAARAKPRRISLASSDVGTSDVGVTDEGPADGGTADAGSADAGASPGTGAQRTIDA